MSILEMRFWLPVFQFRNRFSATCKRSSGIESLLECHATALFRAECSRKMASVPTEFISCGKERKKYWTEQEVTYFLYLIESKHILTLLDGKRYRNADIFTELAKSMDEGGFPRTPDQLRSKWKALKRDFYEAKRRNNTSGSDRSDFAFYDEMSTLLDHRPTTMVAECGVDSIQCEEGSTASTEALGVELDTEDNSGELFNTRPERMPKISRGRGGCSATAVQAAQVDGDPEEAGENSCGPGFNILSPGSRPEKRRRLSRGRGGYSAALTNFAKEFKENNQELMKAQQEWLSQEFAREREWEIQLINQLQEGHSRETREMMNTFLCGLREINRENAQNQLYSQPRSTQSFPQPPFFQFSAPSTSSSPPAPAFFPSTSTSTPTPLVLQSLQLAAPSTSPPATLPAKSDVKSKEK